MSRRSRSRMLGKRQLWEQVKREEELRELARELKRRPDCKANQMGASAELRPEEADSRQ